jgi:hypothetical protein
MAKKGDKMQKGDRVNVWDFIESKWCENCGEVVHNDGIIITVRLNCGLHVQEEKSYIKVFEE